MSLGTSTGRKRIRSIETSRRDEQHNTKSSQQQQQLKMPKTMMKRFVKKTCDSSMIIVWSHLQWLAIAQSRVILCWVVLVVLESPRNS